jgi:glycosyltransferase involved in cell wall biosynthesis
MKNKISLSIFFPAYNEEANLEASVHTAKKIAGDITDTYEIIIIDDGSSDRTPEIADALAASDEKIRVIHHSPNRGYGAALWSGIQAAQYEYVFFTDTDLQFDLSELAILVHFVPEYKVVLGYRAPRRDPFLRLLNAKAWNFLNRFLFGLKVKDIDCAFKLMDRKLVRNIPLTSRGAMMSAEMLIRLERMGVQFKQVPVSHYPRLHGVATGAHPRVIVRAFRELFDLYKGQLGKVSRTQLLTFAGVGIVNTLIDVGIYTLLTRQSAFFGNHLLVAKASSFICGSVFSFFANRIWTFGKTAPVRASEFVRFYLAIGVGLLVNVVSTSILLSVFNVYDIAAVLIATVVTFVWNFTASKLWVYTEASAPEIPPSEIYLSKTQEA